MDGLLRKVLMNFNLAELSDVDDDRLDDDVSDRQLVTTQMHSSGA